MLEVGLEEQRSEGRGLSAVAKDKGKSCSGGGVGEGAYPSEISQERVEGGDPDSLWQL